MDALPAAIPAVTEGLYQRLGGAAGVAAIVDDAVDRHAANPVLAPRLRGRDLPQLKSLSVRFLSAGSGGPALHENRAMPTLHDGMRFGDVEAAAVVADVAAAMVEQGAGAVEVGEVISLLRALKGEALCDRFGLPRRWGGAVGARADATASPAQVQGAVRRTPGDAIGNDPGTGPA